MTDGPANQSSYVTPPPIPRRPANGCLLWGLGGCGIFVVALIVISVFASRSLTGKNSPLQGLAAAPDCKVKLVAIREGLGRYQQDHSGEYPAKLSELIPNYLPDDSNFTFQANDSSAPTPIEYTPPGKEASDETIVAGFETGGFKLSLANVQNATYYVRLLKNGRIVLDQLTRQNVP